MSASQKSLHTMHHKIKTVDFCNQHSLSQIGRDTASHFSASQSRRGVCLEAVCIAHEDASPRDAAKRTYPYSQKLCRRFGVQSRD